MFQRITFIYCNPIHVSPLPDWYTTTWSKKPQSFCTHIFGLSWLVVFNDVRHIKMLLFSLWNYLIVWIKGTGLQAGVSLLRFNLFFSLIKPLFQLRRKAAILCYADRASVIKREITYVVSQITASCVWKKITNFPSKIN